MEKLGTTYGGWFIPKDCNLNENSIIYSVGVGEDLSFDIQLQSKYNCNIFLFDPTKRSIKHFDECKKYYSTNKIYKFTGNIQPDYYTNIVGQHPNFDKITYINTGLWNKKDTLKFYRQTEIKNVSQSLIPNMFSNDYDIVNVDCIKNQMTELKHTHIDLLKMDIEGAEITVLNNMIDENIFPTYLCIEFDLFIKKKDKNNDTKKLINRLISNNYQILINEDMNITFKRQL
jgi:FkbM family methyltransferase